MQPCTSLLGTLSLMVITNCRSFFIVFHYTVIVNADSNEKFVEDNGGRDITITEILSRQLNFTFDSVDPESFGIDRARGSA